MAVAHQGTPVTDQPAPASRRSASASSRFAAHRGQAAACVIGSKFLPVFAADAAFPAASNAPDAARQEAPGQDTLLGLEAFYLALAVPFVWWICALTLTS